MSIIETDALTSDKLLPYHSLNEAQLYHYFEPDEGIFIAESLKVIERALQAGYQPLSMLIERSKLPQAAEIIAAAGDIPVYSCGNAIKEITGYNLTGGILCAFRRKKLASPDELCRNARRIAVLENIVNPTNIGAVFRSAAAMGIDAVLLTPACCDPLYRRAIRVSMGNVFLVPWGYITRDQCEWDEHGAEILHKLGFKTAALALRGDTVTIRDERLHNEPRLAILLGTEGEGLSAAAIAASDYTVKIPMTHGVDSLNVAAASAVAFWELAMKNQP